MLRFWGLILSAALLLSACDCGGSDVDRLLYPCTSDSECRAEFRCIQSVCRPSDYVPQKVDGGAADSGVDAGAGGLDAGAIDSGLDAGGGPDGGGGGGADDSGVVDAGSTDAAVTGDAGGDAGGAGAPDAGTADAGPGDAGSVDSGEVDSGVPFDAGPVDAGPADAGPADAGPPDAGPLAEVPPSTQPPVVVVAGPVVHLVPVGTVIDAGAGTVFNSFVAALLAVADGGTLWVHDGVYTGPVDIRDTHAPVNILAAGASAIVSCATPTGTWSLSSGSTFTISPLSPVAAVFIDGGFLPRARYPVSGFMTLAGTSSSASSLVVSGTDDTFLKTRSLSNAIATTRVVDYWWQTATVTGLDGGVLQLGTVPNDLALACSPNSTCDYTYYPQAGYGFYLENEPWMLTQPGGWAYEPGVNRLSLWLPDSGVPAGNHVTTATAVDCVSITNAPNLSIVGLQVASSGRDGVSAFQSPNLRLSRVFVHEAVRRGITIRESDPAILDDSRVARTGSNCVFHRVSPSPSATLTTTFEANVFEDCGVALGPKFLSAAVSTEPSRPTLMVARNNLFRRSGYNSLTAANGMLVEGNTVLDSCLYADDCGGIYAWAVNNQTIRNNIVRGATVFQGGKPGAPMLAAGIFLDDAVEGSLVENNIVVDTEDGIALHNARACMVRNNAVLASRHRQFFSTEDGLAKKLNLSNNQLELLLDGGFARPASYDNHFVNNLAVDSPTSIAAHQASNQRDDQAGVQDIYGPSGNEYWSLYSPLSLDSQPGFFDFEDLVPQGIDVLARRPTPSLANAYVVTSQGSPLLAFSAGNLGAWSTHANTGTATVELASCPSPSASGVCMKMQASPSTPLSILISPTFALSPSVLYQLRLQVRVDQGAAYRAIPFFRDGTTYENIGAKRLPTVRVDPNGWSTVVQYVQSPTSVNPARFDIEVPQGLVLYVGELVITPVVARPSTNDDHLFIVVNQSYVIPQSSSCPVGGCSGWYGSDGGLTSLPVTLQPRSALVLWRP